MAVQIVIPTSRIEDEEYCAKHVQLQLDEPHARALKSVYRGLEEKGAKLRSGRPIRTNVDAVRWVLEQITHATNGSFHRKPSGKGAKPHN